MEDEVRYCAYCGSILNDDRAFCDACGSRVRDDGGDIPGAVTASPVEIATRSRGQTASQTSKVLSVVGFFIIGLTVVLGANHLISGSFILPVSSQASRLSSYSSMSNDSSANSATIEDTLNSSSDSSNGDVTFYGSNDVSDSSSSDVSNYSSGADAYDYSGDSSVAAVSSDSDFSSGEDASSTSDSYASDDAYTSDIGVENSDGISDSTTPDIVAVDGESAQENVEVNTQGYLAPDADIRYLEQTDTDGFTAQLYNYAKNEIYARHGRLFNSIELQNYFNSQDWYYGFIQPDDFSDSVFNEYEKANLQYLSKMEEELSPGGYPLDQYGYSYDSVYKYLK